jgi:hypothetical protein
MWPAPTTCFFFGFIIHVFAIPLNRVTVFGFPQLRHRRAGTADLRVCASAERGRQGVPRSWPPVVSPGVSADLQASAQENGRGVDRQGKRSLR